MDKVRKILFTLIFSLILISCDDEYQRGYNAGKEEGYKKGKQIGYEEGYQVGKEEGYKEGHQVGYTLGFTEGHDNGYWEGTQFFVAEHWVPTVGFGVLIALFFTAVGIFISIFYKTWLYFFKEKWFRYNTLKQLKELKNSEIFKNEIDYNLRVKKYENMLEKELGQSKLKDKIAQLVVESYAEPDSNYHNLYIDTFKQVAKSKELSNQHKISIYSDVLSFAKQDRA